MRTWRRAERQWNCGAAPNCTIQKGEAYQVLSGDGWEKIRCESHATEPVNTTQLAEFDARVPAP